MLGNIKCRPGGHLAGHPLHSSPPLVWSPSSESLCAECSWGHARENHTLPHPHEKRGEWRGSAHSSGSRRKESRQGMGPAHTQARAPRASLVRESGRCLGSGLGKGRELPPPEPSPSQFWQLILPTSHPTKHLRPHAPSQATNTSPGLSAHRMVVIWPLPLSRAMTLNLSLFGSYLQSPSSEFRFPSVSCLWPTVVQKY